MRSYSYFLALILSTFIFALPAGAANVFKNYDKVIWIDQARQTGAAYEKGQKLYSFRILSGDDETPTPPGAYVVRVKDANYYSRKYQQPMSYSLFFDFKAKRAIHEGAVPDPEEKNVWATHGCIHVEQPTMKKLFDWAEARKTLVVVRGKRDWTLDEQVGEVDEEIQDIQADQERKESEGSPKDQESQGSNPKTDSPENPKKQESQGSPETNSPGSPESNDSEE